jgi:Ca2+-binding RTX toxin-like protein
VVGRFSLLLALVLAAALFAPASSWAASGELTNCDPSPPAPNDFTNCTMVYTGDPGTNNAVVTLVDVSEFSTGNYQVHDPDTSIAPTSPCFNDGADATRMKCPVDDVARLQVSLGGGNDTISIQIALPASIGGGGGDDSITASAANDSSLRGGDGSDTIDGGGGDDVLWGDNTNNTPGANDGSDTLRGGQGNDTLNGEAGDDTFVAEPGADGTDVLNGGSGVDTASFALRTQPQALSIDGVANDGEGATPSDNIQTDVENVIGGAGPDTITGSAGPNGIGGGAGDDSVAGGDGDDAMDGGDGNDVVDGGAGVDVVTGSGGNDTLMGDAGGDSLAGGDGNDSLAGGDDGDTLAGDAGNDNLIGGSGDDTVRGGGDQDTLAGGDGADALEGGDGADTLAGEAENDTLNGEAGSDNIAGGIGTDALDGGADDDTLAGDDGADSLAGGPGNDNLDGGAGADAIGGGDGVDGASYASRTAGVTVTLDGSAGDGEPGENDDVKPDVENVTGGSGADTVIGSDAANRLEGGGGEDYADGGKGADTLIGGDSGDVLRSRGGTGPADITCGPGPDFVVAKASDKVASDCDNVDRGVRQRPTRRKTALVTPARGTLEMSPAGIVRGVPLEDKVVLPLRSGVDTREGRVRVTSAPAGRRTESVTLFDGEFDITQTRAKRAVTQLALDGGDFAACGGSSPGGTAAAHVAAVKKGKRVRRLWASGKGKFRTKGRYAAASVRGTFWLTEDRCDGTLIRVRKGRVAVRDLVKKKTVVVRAGRSYFAVAKRR